jgi:His-Xaa-Ser system radical SAM maturase HxsB
MTPWPLRFREIDGELFFSDEAGGYFLSTGEFLDRYARGKLSAGDEEFLYAHGHASLAGDELSFLSFARRWAARQAVPDQLQYVILVPTLRCNLACSYCQVSRAAENASGYDWTEDTTEAVIAFLERLETRHLKVEFQGGEPTLRLDLLERVRSFCRRRFKHSEFVVCTNLQIISEESIAFLSADDTFVSTSIDGAGEDHRRHRTLDHARTAEFFRNLDAVRSRVAPGHLAALPTIDLRFPPQIDALIDFYERLGLRSIFLRPVNYQGFARRDRSHEEPAERWTRYHLAFIDRLINRNFDTGRVMEEFHFVHCLRRVLAAGHDGHVDLRNPASFGSDYIVVDYDGRLHPTDEARMMDRVGQVDLSVGSVHEGIDQAKVDILNGSAINNFDPDCIHCAYQPYCGSDPIDSISRYGRVDIPKSRTWFCNRQLALFDRAVRLIYSEDERDLFSLRHWLGLEQWPQLLAPVHQ